MNQYNLDIGCGYSKQHKKKAEIGIDLKKGLCTIQASAYKLPFRKNTFKKIIMSHVLEHLINIGIVLNEIKRILEPQGILMIEVPNPYAFFRLRNMILGNALHGESKEHIASYCIENLKNLMCQINFKIIYVCSTFQRNLRIEAKCQ